MLYRELLIKELNSRREDFARFAESQSDELENYLGLLHELGSKKSEEVRRDLGNKEDVGALPSQDLDEFSNVSSEFSPRWQNHEQARTWALAILQNRTTFAADASQILPGREISLPVAAIQVGTFENLHTASGDYRKQARFIVIPPNELLDTEADEEKPVNAETLVGLRRFQEEIRSVSEFLKAKKNWRSRGERMPLAFFDGTLLVSFSQPKSKIQNEFIKAVIELVALSEQTEVPLVGYVDQSYARDLISLLDAINQSFLHQPSRTLTDAQLLSNADALKFWGDRTAFFYCKRPGLSESFGNSVGFVYLQTTSEGIPARLDVPSWIYEAGLLEELLDTIRAECVTGLGYPYVLETADATAVITVRDREMFLRALQDFALRETLNFRVANKKMSKARRR